MGRIISIRARVYLRIALVILLALASFSYGFLAHRYRLFPYGIIRSAYRLTSMESTSRAQGNNSAGRAHQGMHQADRAEEVFSKLAALPYLRGYHAASNKQGVTAYEKGLAFDGVNIYTSGHAPEALLVDMTGKVLHKWKYDAMTFRHDWWRRVHLFENGDLLAIYEGDALIKLDKNSNLLWTYAGKCHHDMFVADNGDIYVLTYKPRVIPRIRERQAILDDVINVLNPDGEVMHSFSLLECFEKSRYSSLVENIPIPKYGDILHTNTLEILDGKLAHRSPVFSEGNVLTSMRTIDTVAIVDLNAEEVVWALTGMWKKQHEPVLLTSGNMLIFDNLGNNGKSRVMEFDPFSQQVVWQYGGDSQNEFFSGTCGSNQRLPNGNTLIVESTKGRVFEVTPDNEVVWEFLNPHRVGEGNELVATIYDMVRLMPDFSFEWLAED